MNPVPATKLPEPPAAPPARSQWILYSLLVMLSPVIVFALLLWVASTPWFLAHNAYPALRNVGYETTLEHADCQVLLYGDSSALTALDPEVVSRLTGLTSCNISEGYTVQAVVGSYALDYYLRHNLPPRYLVMQYSAYAYRPNMPPGTDFFPEGYTYLLQSAPVRMRLNILLRRPDRSLRYASWVASQLILDAWGRLNGRNPDNPAKDGRAERVRRRGILTYPYPPETQCTRTYNHNSADQFRGDAAGVQTIRTRYSINGTRVLVNVAPIPECDVLRDSFQAIVRGQHDNAFELLPISDFNNEDVHLDTAGATHVSTEVAAQILALEAAAPPIASREASQRGLSPAAAQTILPKAVAVPSGVGL